jgi:alkanesulfonate monooxygenase SsuD/methylene tetrahydromethanopterin reductase-like flavin-dependent oxidoreductase (luciferase family)
MNIGLSAYDMDGQDLVDLAVAADSLGFDALWLGDHVVLPVEYSTPHPTTSSATNQHHTGPI